MTSWLVRVCLVVEIDAHSNAPRFPGADILKEFWHEYYRQFSGIYSGAEAVSCRAFFLGSRSEELFRL